MTTALVLDDPDRLREQLAELAELCVQEARSQGASAAEAAVSASTGLSVTVRNGEVETVEHNRDKGLGVTVYFGQHKGSASSSDFSRSALAETVRAAGAIARYTGEDAHAGLADAEHMATAFPDLDLYHPWALDAERAIAIALRAEAAALGHDTRISSSDGASVGSHDNAHAYANSHGFIGHRVSTRHSLSARVIARDAAGMQRDYWYDTARDAADMATPESIGLRAAERTLGRLSPQRIATGDFPVLFAPEIAASLFGHLLGAIGGGAQYRKASFLVEQAGKQIFPGGFRIHEQPHLRRAAGSASFDSEGVATRARDIVSDGVLQGYVLNTYTARRLGLTTTGNAGGVRNLCIEPGTQDQAALLAGMQRGLLVTELMGMGVNTVTGDYSRGAAGYWVEDGELRHPVQEITIAGNLREMFLGIQAVGADVDQRGNIRTGSVLIERMTIAGD